MPACNTAAASSAAPPRDTFLIPGATDPNPADCHLDESPVSHGNQDGKNREGWRHGPLDSDAAMADAGRHAAVNSGPPS